MLKAARSDPQPDSRVRQEGDGANAPRMGEGAGLGWVRESQRSLQNS